MQEMMFNPRIGELATVWYRKSNRHLPYHGKRCRVGAPSRGKPRNHLVVVIESGDYVVVPCGNLMADKNG